MTMTSRLSGLRNDSPSERRRKATQQLGLSNDSLDVFSSGGLTTDQMDRMIENVIGCISVPVGIATNFIVNGRDVLVPMATEEPSVVAAASNAARWARSTGGFSTGSTEPIMQAQIQLVDVPDPHSARARILDQEERLLSLANDQDPRLVEIGGGAREIRVHIIAGSHTTHVVTHLLVDVGDAMGANAVNSMAEALAPQIAEISGGRSLMRILTNKADLRLARAWVTIDPETLGGEKVVDDMLLAADLANHDPYRAATHNKGIMNGISAVVLATGNDTRAVEAGAHSHAARNGKYTSLSRYEKNAQGQLTASLELPMSVGLVGGATKSHAAARAAIAITQVTTAQGLGELICAVGLAQNIAALRALAVEGIQKGHMSLHARNVAVAAGAQGPEVDEISARMVDQGAVRIDVAEALLNDLRNQ